MSDIAIRVENLGKAYHIGLKDERSDTMAGALASWVRKPLKNIQRLRRLNTFRANGDEDRDDILWALKDVSFDVKQGEVLGVIGRNGAGKSTLLKILSRITEPTKGRATIHGRVSSLLEVGTGFHPELTGRENVYLNGTILGMTKREIDRKFDEIVDFSGVEKFLDTPVKRYSSGMRVRLAFAVAAHLDPEILMIDEVLAVGDFEFQKKCLGKMGDVARSGRTILFVSHNMQAVSTLTERCLVLSQGQTLFQGQTSDVISHYLGNLAHAGLNYVAKRSDSEACITRVELSTTEPNNVQLNGEPMTVHLELYTPRPIREARVACQICDPLGQPVLHLATFDSQRPMCRKPGTYLLTCRIPKLRLYMGQYRLTVHFAQAVGQPKLEQIDDVCPFEVAMYRQQRDYAWQTNQCTYLEEHEWTVQKE